MSYQYSVSSAFVVLASMLLAPAFLLPRWAHTTILGGGNLGIWQMFTCSPLTDIPTSWYVMRTLSILALLSNMVAVAALVAHVTVVRIEKRKASLRTFTIAAYISIGFELLLIVTYAVIHGEKASFLSYSFGLTLLGTLLMAAAAVLGTLKSSMY